MLNSIEYITNKVNIQKWQINDLLGNPFEEKIYYAVIKQLQDDFDKGVRVYHTSASRDDGRDIIIESPISLPHLLNYNFSLQGKDKINILIECKSTTSTQVRLEKIIGNVSRIKESGADYFVLATNASITPYTHYRLYEDLRMYGIELVLVDQYLLVQYLTEQDEMFGTYETLNFIPNVEGEYQSLLTKENGRNCYELYMSFRNYSDSHHHLELNLLTDRNWRISENTFETILDPHGHIVRKLRVTREFNDGIDDVIFKVILGKTETQFHIRGKDLSPCFEPPFLGKDRIPLRDYLAHIIPESNIIYLYGDAGMGKTRLIQEVFKQLDGQNIVFGFFTLGRKNILQKIKEFLYSKLNNESIITSLSNMVKNYENPYMHTVLFIDDLHNADKSLLDDIRLLAEGFSAPVTILMCGRTDFSAGNTDYFSFAQWAIEMPAVNAILLNPLSADDTELIIRQLINQVPEIVLDKLTHLSQNNPLYIVQYIEYMLEVDLLTLVNRNTVGIQNMERFLSHDYMPDSIEKIYEARYNNLNIFTCRKSLENLLYTCTIAHGSLTSDQLVDFLGDEENTVEILVERGFLKIDLDGNFIFIHESLYLYFSRRLHKSRKVQKHISKLLFTLPTLYSTLERLDQGMLLLWAGKYEQSKERFSLVIERLIHMDNHSSINIDISIYDYLYVIYDLLEKDCRNKTILKNIILARIYIALHYFTPQKALEECKIAMTYIQQGVLKDEQQLKNTLLEHQAHSSINAGNLVVGELILKQLQATFILCPNDMEADTVFDMYDKFCNIYIKQNNYDLANTYNLLSLQQADKTNDDNLKALSYISSAKIHFYCNPSYAYYNIEQADKLLCQGISDRIYCHNEITKLVYSCVYDLTPNWHKLYSQASILLERAVNNSYGNSVIRAYMLLALSAYMRNDCNKDEIQKLISRGIDASIRFGIGTYTWQFYNLQAVMYSKLGIKTEDIMLLFNTVFSILGRQNLLYLSNCDFCYGNLLAISNIAYFWQGHDMETSFYQKATNISYTGSMQTCDYDCAKSLCGYVCTDTLVSLKQQYQKAKEKELLFCNDQHEYPLRDEHTGYFLIIS